MGLVGLPKLIATDLDGTLVRSDETVSDYSIRCCARCAKPASPSSG